MRLRLALFGIVHYYHEVEVWVTPCGVTYMEFAVNRGTGAQYALPAHAIVTCLWCITDRTRREPF